MKIVTCATRGQLRKETIDALTAHWMRPNYLSIHMLTDGDVFGYGKTLQKHWEQGEDFAIVEPDIVIRKDVADAFLNCPYAYCCFPYAWVTNIGPALGCTRFRTEFLRDHPTAMREATNTGVSWRQLDVVLQRHILWGVHKEQPHVHLPPVEHLNEAKQLMEGADPTPMMAVPTDIGNLCAEG